MRSFLAFEIPRDIKNYLSQVSSAMARTVRGVRWVKPEGQHITIKFFGEITDVRAQEIKDILASCGPYGPVLTSLKDIDAFPGRRKPRVIVATIEEGVDIIRSIYHDIEDRLTVLGFDREKRDFTPHITFGRMKVPVPLLERDIAILEKRIFTIENIVLYQSILAREGAAYVPLFEKKMDGKA